MPLPWAIPPGPRAGVWALSAPGQAAFGEVIVYDHPATVVIPSYSGKFIRMHQPGVPTSFDYLSHDPTNTGVGAGPGTNIVQMDCRLLCRFDPTQRVYLFSNDVEVNVMFWTGIDGAQFSVNYISTWSPYTPVNHLVDIPVDITASTWVWIRQRVTGPGDLVLDYSLDHTNPSPATWTPLGTWAVSAIPIRPSGLGAGKPWAVGISRGGTVATGNLDVRRISYTFNGDAPILSTYEVDPVVATGPFSQVVHPDTTLGTDKNYITHTDMTVTVETE